MATLSMALAGCEGGGSLFSNGPTAEVATAPPPPPQPQYIGRMTLAPIIGAPEAVSKQIVDQITQAGERQRIAISTAASPPADYTLRGYIVASRDKAGSKVSYIWDVADAKGQRVNRITGEELAAGTPNARDPWALVTASVTQTIADKTAGSLATWLPSQPKGGAAPVPVAAATSSGTTTPASASAPVQPASLNTTTAALPQGGAVAAASPIVAGAPGDGNRALASALQQELGRQGVKLADVPGSYKIEGKVLLGATKDGKQPIRIDWRVRDPQGKSLGTVSQKNEIPPGSLDGEWGKTADAAAAAAAQGIIKLLPQGRSTN